MPEDALTKADEGKLVLNTDGTTVGRLVDVRDGYGYVEPNPTLLETIKAKLGWATRSDEAHPLDEGSIEKITDDAVYLRGTL
ncbi:PRC-barrel domain containing protein [Natronorubrum aibiense]|uniref:PRC-barrel domain containing protein n=1 Tax=Natronorubrum aibiense TaxID=348826 RepID=A0A5P9P0B8_9EURY|nr:PRC-barrel domain containing protein [Natronorubrum aibiense]QFU81582.1 PRC-barrel domain containing protein [Natronorubrum aibiense]